MDKVKLATFCGGCSFYDDGCSIGVLEAFKKAGAEVVDNSGTPGIDSVCPYYSTDRISYDEVSNRVRIGGTIIVLCQESSTVDEIEKTIGNIKSAKGSDKFKVVVAHGKNIEPYLVKPLCNGLDDYTIVNVMTGDDASFIDEAFRRIKNGMVFVVEAGKVFDSDFLVKINNVANVKMKKVLYVEPKEGLHMMCFMAVVYKFLKGSKIFLFHDKITEVAKLQGNESLLWNWEGIDECYSN